LIVHGTKDVVVDVANAVVLEENLADAILLMLPDAGHGAQSQYSDVFLANAKLFLGN
jgi:pimeloyl-ACP methyl ester carboxylesterase